MPETVGSKLSQHKYIKNPISNVRKLYVMRLIGRGIVLVLCILMCIFAKSQLKVLKGWNFLKHFSMLHILWGVWMMDMIFQLVPVKKYIPLGSQKHFKLHFRPIMQKINYPALKDYVVSTTKAAYKVFILWAAMITAIGILYYTGMFNDTVLFMITVIFYVCDLICVLIWCPFRLIMRNRCCTTCRIFNWDHLMMFTPMLFIDGVFSRSLLLMAFAVWMVWELCVMMYPERFWENTNEALRCSMCTDKLCTQYCQKLRQ